MSKHRFEVVWAEPGGNEIARWEFDQGGPTPEGFRMLPVSKTILETVYLDGEFAFSSAIGPPYVPESNA